MTRHAFIALAILFGATAPGLGFSTRGQVAMKASVTVSTGTASSLTVLATPLSSEAFFGKNVVIPIQVISPSISSTGLRVQVVYSLYDKNNIPTGLGVVSRSVAMTRDPTRTDTMVGNAEIPRSDLQPIEQGGRLDYMFQASYNGTGGVNGAHGPAAGPGAPLTVLNDPYQTTIIDQWCEPVDSAGARIRAPDLYVTDGRTEVAVPAGAVTGPGTLCIKSENGAAWPAGPGGSKAASIYSIDLRDTSLASTAELVLSYPSDAEGKVLDLGADAGTLGIYWLDQTNGALPSGRWRPLSRAKIDTTLHTVTGKTSHFSTFALFALGAVGAPGLRPSERIITPNGDPYNARAYFLGVDGEINIFDVRGRRVRSISVGTLTYWDGTDDSGRIVESGVYIYQYTSEGERVSGVIGVAK